jgi:NADPH:quinone reductase
MRAVVIRAFGGPEVLDVVEAPMPEPGTAQVRIRTVAAAVNLVDVQTRTGELTAGGLLPPRDVIGIGWDVAGVVDAVGPGVTMFRPGDQVLGLSDRLALPLKAQAEYVVLDDTAVGALPDGMDLTAAATLPLNGLTAAQALDLTGLERGQTLLVTGAAGSVGGYAVEIGARLGLRVIAVAGEGDRRFLDDVGAEHVVLRDAELPAAVRRVIPGGVDAVVDTASVGMLALDAVRGGGVFVPVLGRAPVPLRGISVRNVWIRADGPRLGRLAAMRLSLRVAQTLPLAAVADAHRLLDRAGLRGRPVLTP